MSLFIVQVLFLRFAEIENKGSAKKVASLSVDVRNFKQRLVGKKGDLFYGEQI